MGNNIGISWKPSHLLTAQQIERNTRDSSLIKMFMAVNDLKESLDLVIFVASSKLKGIGEVASLHNLSSNRANQIIRKAARVEKKRIVSILSNHKRNERNG